MTDKHQTAAASHERSVLTPARDPRELVKAAREEWDATAKDRRPFSASRAIAELVSMLESSEAFKDKPLYDRAKFYLDVIRLKLPFPEIRRFYPRNNASLGANQYNQDYFKLVEYSPHGGHSDAPGAQGFAEFDPDTGYFQQVAVSTGNQVQLFAGPTITIETTTPVDAVITTNALIDYLYTISSSPNPAFVQSALSGAGQVTVEFALQPLITCRSKNTNAVIPFPSKSFGYKQVRNVTVDFNLQNAPYATASGHEIHIARSEQDSALSLPLSFDSEVQLPGNARCEISVVAYCSSDALGGPDPRIMYTGYGEARLSGQFPSIEAYLYS